MLAVTVARSDASKNKGFAGIIEELRSRSGMALRTVGRQRVPTDRTKRLDFGGWYPKFWMRELLAHVTTALSGP